MPRVDRAQFETGSGTLEGLTGKARRLVTCLLCSEGAGERVLEVYQALALVQLRHDLLGLCLHRAARHLLTVVRSKLGVAKAARNHDAADALVGLRQAGTCFGSLT